MKSTIKKLPDTEFEVMQAIWRSPIPATRSDVEVLLKDTHPMALTTLLTILTRLADKEFIRIEKEGRTSRYYPLVAEQDYLAAQGNRFFNKLCGGNLKTFATALCDSGLTKEDLAELRELLEREEL